MEEKSQGWLYWDPLKFLDSLGIYTQEIKSVEIITILVHGILIRVQNELGYIKHRLRLMLILLWKLMIIIKI